MDLYYAAFESSPDLIICVDEKGKILRVNRQAEAVLGYDRREIIGKPMETLVPEHLAVTHAAGPEDLCGSMMPAQPHPMLGESRLTARRKDGSGFPVDVLLSTALTPKGLIVIAVLRDATERRAAEIRHKEMLGHLQLSAEAAGIGYWTFDDSTHKFWCDERYAGLFGGHPGGFTTLDAVLERIHPDDREPRRRRAAESLEKHGKYESEFRIILPDGNQRWIADLGRHIGEGNETHLFAGVAFDITERKSSERKQAEMIRELQQSLIENKVLRGLLPICSHCKKIRDEEGNWQAMETYLRMRTDARFSHGICPACLREHYSGFNGLASLREP